MHSPLKQILTMLGLLGALVGGMVSAAPTTPPAPAQTATPAKPTAPPASAPVKAAASAPKPLPAAPVTQDYGGRDNAPLPVSDTAPNPIAQAGRALEALVIVLAGIVGVVYALKRFGLVMPGADGKPGRIALPPLGLSRLSPAVPSSVPSPITIVSSQALPGGTMLHVVTVAGRTLLLAATGHTVTTVTEWAEEPRSSEGTRAFEDFLTRAEPEPVSSIAAANARLRSLLSASGERA